MTYFMKLKDLALITISLHLLLCARLMGPLLNTMLHCAHRHFQAVADGWSVRAKLIFFWILFFIQILINSSLASFIKTLILSCCLYNNFVRERFFETEADFQAAYCWQFSITPKVARSSQIVQRGQPLGPRGQTSNFCPYSH